MEAKYKLNLNNKQLKGPFENSSPVLDIFYNSESILQLGLNIGHVKSSEVYFQNLVGDHNSTKKDFFDYHVLGGIFDYFYSIMHSDSSISTFTWNKLNTYQISFSDENLEKILLEENRKCRTRKIKQMLWKNNFKPSLALVQHLNRSPEDYSIVLSMIYDSNEELIERGDFIVPTGKLRENFHKDILRIIKSQENRNLDKERKSLKEIGRALGNFKGKQHAEVGLIRKNHQKLKERLAEEASLTRNKEKLITIYDKFLKSSRNYAEEEDFSWDLFSDIWKMPTTLHEKTNKEYSPDIVTFQFKEPITRYKERECLFVKVIEPKKE